MADANGDSDAYDLVPDEPAAKPQRPKARPAAAPAEAGGSKPAWKAGPPTARQVAAAMPGARRGPPGGDAHDTHARRQVKLLAWSAGGALVLVVGLILAFKLLGPAAAPSLGEDALAKQVMATSDFEEARGWLTSGNNRMLMGHTVDKSKYRIDALYALGAKQVLAGGGRMSANLVIELSDDKAARQKLIDWANEWHEKYKPTHPRQSDVGQKYLVAEMPLSA